MFNKLNEEYFNIYKAGVENFNSVNLIDKKRLPKRNLLLIFYYILISIFNKVNKKGIKEVAIVNGKSNRKNLSCAEFLGENCVYRGGCFNNPFEIFSLYTVVSPIKKRERLRVLLFALKTYKDIKGVGDLGSWIDFVFLLNFLQRLNPSEIKSRVHYDMWATWLGELSYRFGYNYSIYQHGIVLFSTTIPNKYHCDNFYAFDQYSMQVFKRNCIINEDCVYKVYPFKCSVKFESFNNKFPNKKYIGIIEQYNKDFVSQVLHKLEAENVVFIIMKHPFSTIKYKRSKTIIVTKKKIFNVDLVITNSSTLILDYFRAGFVGDIFYTSKELKDVLKEYKNIKYIELNDSCNI